MPRKRSIKPDFNSDEDIAALSPWARLFYIGLWGHMDRNGLIGDNPKLLRALVFPLDENLSTADITKLRDELLKPGPSGRPRLVRLTHMGKTLLFCPTLSTHQKIYADEPALFDVPRPLLDEIRKEIKKAQPIQVDSVPQPGTVPVAVHATGLVPAMTRASASPSSSAPAPTLTETFPLPSASAALEPVVDNSEGASDSAEAEEPDPLIKMIDGLIARGSNDSALEMISKLPVRKQVRFGGFIDQLGRLGKAAKVGNA